MRKVSLSRHCNLFTYFVICCQNCCSFRCGFNAFRMVFRNNIIIMMSLDNIACVMFLLYYSICKFYYGGVQLVFRFFVSAFLSKLPRSVRLRNSLGVLSFKKATMRSDNESYKSPLLKRSNKCSWLFSRLLMR